MEVPVGFKRTYVGIDPFRCCAYIDKVESPDGVDDGFVALVAMNI